MSEPTVNLPREGDVVLLRVTVIDAHWWDKGLYKVSIPTQRGSIEQYVRARDLREEEQA